MNSISNRAAPRRRHAFRRAALRLALALAIAGMPALARADTAGYTLVLKDHRFQPATIEIQANTRVRLTVRNLDPTPEEFDSFDLNREKVVMGGGQGVVYIGPLDPGTYKFMGEFHAATAQGRIVAK